MLCWFAAFTGFIVSSTLEANGFWTPIAIAVSGSLIGPFFITGLLLTILSFSAVTIRLRQIGLVATVVLLVFVWYPLWGHEAVTLLMRAVGEAYSIAERRYCVLPVIDI